MTGTGRARRNGAEGDTQPAAPEARPPKPAEPKLNSPQKSEPEARLRTDLPPLPKATPTLGNETPKMAAPTPAPAAAKSAELFTDAPSPSVRAPGGTNDPLDIPAFLRRQGN